MTRWYTKEELLAMRTANGKPSVSFNVGDYDQFACDNVKGIWWYTTETGPEKHNYFGPYRTKHAAAAAYQNVAGRTAT